MDYIPANALVKLNSSSMTLLCTIKTVSSELPEISRTNQSSWTQHVFCNKLYFSVTLSCGSMTFQTKLFEAIHLRPHSLEITIIWVHIHLWLFYVRSHSLQNWDHAVFMIFIWDQACFTPLLSAVGLIFCE